MIHPFLSLITVASLLLALDTISHGAPTAGVDAPPESSETDHEATTSPMIAAEDSSALESRVGSDAIVEGLVKNIGRTATTSMTFLNFTESKSGFVAVVFRSAYDKFPEGFDKYTGQHVRVHGVINKYKDRQLQIVITTPDQLEVVQGKAENVSSSVPTPSIPTHTSYDSATTSITIDKTKEEIEEVVKDNGMGQCRGAKTTTEFTPNITLAKNDEDKTTTVKFYAVLENKNDSGIKIANFPEGINIKELKSSTDSHPTSSASSFKYVQSDWSCSCCKNVKFGILKGYYAEVVSDGKVIASTSSDLGAEYKEGLEKYLSSRSNY
jgi:hypothetical protein